MEKLLFTGGTGFLGTNVKPILDKAYEVTTIGITDRDMIKVNLVTGVPDLPAPYGIFHNAKDEAHTQPCSFQAALRRDKQNEYLYSGKKTLSSPIIFTSCSLALKILTFTLPSVIPRILPISL